jgi:hypothetical protein
MNFSSREWIFICVLDASVKIVYTYCAFFLLTFIAAPVAPFVYIGVAISLFHFFCLFLAFSAAASLELIRIELSRAWRFPLILVLANGLFVAGLSTLFVMTIRPGEIGRTAVGGVGISLFLMTTNLVALSLSVGFHCLTSRAQRLN